MRKFLPLCALMVTSCSRNPPPRDGVGAWQEMSARYAVFSSRDKQPLATALVRGTDSLPDTALVRLLSTRTTLPARIVIGILQLTAPESPRAWWAQAGQPDPTQTVIDSAVAVLSLNPRITRVAFLPGLIAGTTYSTATLRDAAARLQADAVLIYRPSCRVWDRAPFIGPVEYRSACTVEAVLLETRQGLMPFTAIVTREDTTRHHSSEPNTEATVTRSQLAATWGALRDVLVRTGSFVATVPESTP